MSGAATTPTLLQQIFNSFYHGGPQNELIQVSGRCWKLTTFYVADGKKEIISSMTGDRDILHKIYFRNELERIKNREKYERMERWLTEKAEKGQALTWQ